MEEKPGNGFDKVPAEELEAAVSEANGEIDSFETSHWSRKLEREGKLGQWHATAICGNDITSSCLYVAALSTAAAAGNQNAGSIAPIALLTVAAILYMYRKVYTEVVSALPLNGGAYNCLLNSTSKFKASMAACLTIISYIATAVISAKVAVSYFSTLPYVREIQNFGSEALHTSGGGHAGATWPILTLTIGVLSIFAILAILGITESARVALGIFILHISTLTLFAAIGIVHVIKDVSVFQLNWNLGELSGNALLVGLFVGFSSALLGISGFESSANFVEEQKQGVFPKTLRNMWITVSIFNPLIAFLALGVLPIGVTPDVIVNGTFEIKNEVDGVMTIAGEENIDYLLANMANVMAGNWLNVLVSIDAALVLCGAILTSFVGVNGLVKRMTLDRCLPQLLLKENRRKTNHRIILSFLALSASIVLLTQGDLKELGGVYTISFLGVMSLFAIGNMLLKVNRKSLKREYKASWLVLLVALMATVIGIIGNVYMNPDHLAFFLYYFVPTVAVVAIMFIRIGILRVLLGIVDGITQRLMNWNKQTRESIEKKIDEINDLGIIFFTKGDSVATLNLAMQYVLQNELTKRIRVIHCFLDERRIPPRLEQDLKNLDEIYPELEIEFVKHKGRFGPELIQNLSEKYNVPLNYMFIGAPGEYFPHNIAELGGVRLII